MLATGATVEAGIGNAQDIGHDTGSEVMVNETSTPSAVISEHRHWSTGNYGRTSQDMSSVDFVILAHLKSMSRMAAKESLAPIAVMCVIFFLWGFAYGFIDVLDAQFRQAAGSDLATSFELHAAFFGAYLFGPILVARPILNQWGFKATLVTGLLIYSCGTLAFWPAAILVSLPGFAISNFIAGLGLSVVETTTDLFMTLCGPIEYAEMRLNFARGIQAIGEIFSPLLAQGVLFEQVTSPTALINIQWAYLVITIITMLVAVTYNLLQLPEASKDDLKQLADRRREDYRALVCNIRVVWVTLVLGFLCLFCNIGGQENIQTKFRTFVLYDAPR